MNKPIAIIPARGGSKRLPRKNILPIGEQPMISWPIKTALDSGIFQDVYVTTEDDEISDIATQYGAKIITRPEKMATDTAHEGEAYKHAILEINKNGIEFDYFCAIYPTAIFIKPNDLVNSYKQVQIKKPAVLMSTSEFNYHPYKSLKIDDNNFASILFPKECKMRSQHYPKLVASNGTFYWCNKNHWIQNMDYYPDNLQAYIIPHMRAIDIDTQEDFEIAQKIFKIIK